MRRRLAACDSCRSAKVACDHLRPTCTRCLASNGEQTCTYRERPFKRKHGRPNITKNSQTETSPRPPRDPSKEQVACYPNPGYLGPFSQAAIFRQLPFHDEIISGSADTTGTHSLRNGTGTFTSDSDVLLGAEVLRKAFASFNVSLCSRLVETWLSKGYNLALAGSFTAQCANSIGSVSQSLTDDTNRFKQMSARLFGSSSKPLSTGPESTIAEFSASFCNDDLRWEALSLFFTGICRAIVDVERFEPIYSTMQTQRQLQRDAMQLSDQCLDMALSLDCMNDLQLIAQYENFIAHSVVDGDQSYNSWKRLGNAISSLFALGYHRRTDNDVFTPSYIKSLRTIAIARIYSAEINVSIFFGRPPRIRRRDLHSLRLVENGEAQDDSLLDYSSSANHAVYERVEHAADTGWSAKCAMLKEDILDIFNQTVIDEKSRRANVIKDSIQAQWSRLPPHLRLEGDLKLCNRTSTERDLLVSIRLQYFHVLFLVEMSLMENLSEPGLSLVQAAAGILRLIAQAVVLKSYLINSGTGLLWKVVHYGLPAAGIICLSLSKRISTLDPAGPTTMQLFQDLSTLVTQVETGALVQAEHPNYPLLSRAVTMIRSVLDRTLNKRNITNGPVEAPASTPLQINADNNIDFLDSWFSQDSWDFGHEFWPALAEFPYNSTFGGDL